jgi:hypothetical protein
VLVGYGWTGMWFWHPDLALVLAVGLLPQLVVMLCLRPLVT